MNRNDFILPVSIVKMQEKKLLTEQKLIKMLETNSSKEILKILSETDYSYSMEKITSEDMYEDMLVNETKRVFKFTRELAKKNQEIVDLIALKYEYQNLKLMLKNDISNLDLTKYLLETDIKDKDRLTLNFNKAKKEKNTYNQTIILDKLYLEHIYDLANSMEFDVFKKYASLIIDKYNVISFLRLKNQNRNIDYVEDIFVNNGSISKEDLIKAYDTDHYIELFKKHSIAKYWENYKKEKNIADIEKMYDNLIIQLAIDYRNVTIGPEPIFTYIIAKEYEIKALRLIISAKLNSIDTDIVKQRMRGVYV